MRSWALVVLVAAAGCGSPGVTGESGAAACITASACGIIPGGISACTQLIAYVNDPEIAGNALFPLNAREVNCIGAAGADCDAARRCLNEGKTPSPCAGSSTSCMGNTLPSGSDVTGAGGNKGTRQFDCGSVRQMCAVDGNSAGCGYGTCAGFLSRCTGNVREACEGGILKRQDCAKQSAICVPGDFGTT